MFAVKIELSFELLKYLFQRYIVKIRVHTIHILVCVMRERNYLQKILICKAENDKNRALLKLGNSKALEKEVEVTVVVQKF